MSISTRQAERRSVGLPGRSRKRLARHSAREARAIAAAGDEGGPIQQTIERAERHAGAHRSAEPDARHWAMALTPYREPSLARSLVGLFVTAVPFVALWLLMLLSLRYSYWLCLLLAMPAAGFLVRLFMIQHDCGPRLVLPPAARQRLARPRARGADPHALWLLAA